MGRPDEDGFFTAAADCTILTGAWGMVQLSEEHLAKLPRVQAVCYAAGSVKNFVSDASYARGVRHYHGDACQCDSSC